MDIITIAQWFGYVVLFCLAVRCVVWALRPVAHVFDRALNSSLNLEITTEEGSVVDRTCKGVGAAMKMAGSTAKAIKDKVSKAFETKPRRKGKGKTVTHKFL